MSRTAAFRSGKFASHRSPWSRRVFAIEISAASTAMPLLLFGQLPTSATVWNMDSKMALAAILRPRRASCQGQRRFANELPGCEPHDLRAAERARGIRAEQNRLAASRTQQPLFQIR